jgi:putative transposase
LLVDALKEHYTLPELLAQLDLARSSYFYHRGRVKMADKYLVLRQTITDIFELNHRCYGYRRLQASLTRQCITISEKVMQRLMKQEGLVVSKPKRRQYGSYLGEISPTPENLINRDFRAAAPNEKWLTDTTEFQIPAGKVYRSPIIDCFDGLVISWSIGAHPDAELVNTMLDAAIETVTELFYPRDWKATTIEQFIQVVDSYIRWYNAKRIKRSVAKFVFDSKTEWLTS